MEWHLGWNEFKGEWKELKLIHRAKTLSASFHPEGAKEVATG